MAREITEQERQVAADMLEKARTAMVEIADYDQGSSRRFAAGSDRPKWIVVMVPMAL